VASDEVGIAEHGFSVSHADQLEVPLDLRAGAQMNAANRLKAPGVKSLRCRGA
jgi:hypothetical protein